MFNSAVETIQLDYYHVAINVFFINFLQNSYIPYHLKNITHYTVKRELGQPYYWGNAREGIQQNVF